MFGWRTDRGQTAHFGDSRTPLADRSRRGRACLSPFEPLRPFFRFTSRASGRLRARNVSGMAPARDALAEARSNANFAPPPWKATWGAIGLCCIDWFPLGRPATPFIDNDSFSIASRHRPLNVSAARAAVTDRARGTNVRVSPPEGPLPPKSWQTQTYPAAVSSRPPR